MQDVLLEQKSKQNGGMNICSRVSWRDTAQPPMHETFISYLSKNFEYRVGLGRGGGGENRDVR